MRLKGTERCEYCGMTATVLDHVVPWAFSHMRGERKTNNKRDVIPACRECNSLASDTVFETIEEKREFIQGRVARRYSKLLKMPTWTTKELGEVSHQLRRSILLSMRTKRLIEARLRWPYNWYEEQDITRGVFDELFASEKERKH